MIYTDKIERDLYNRIYEIEKQRENDLYSRMNLPTIILSFSIGIYAILLEKFKYIFSQCFFTVLFVLSASLFLISLFYYARSLLFFSYKDFPSLDNVRTDFEEIRNKHLLKDYYEKNKNNLDEKEKSDIKTTLKSKNNGEKVLNCIQKYSITTSDKYLYTNKKVFDDIQNDEIKIISNWYFRCANNNLKVNDSRALKISRAIAWSAITAALNMLLLILTKILK